MQSCYRVLKLLPPRKNNMINKKKPFAVALAQMPPSELALLLDRIETLAQDFQKIPLREGESVTTVAAAQKVLKMWTAEIKRILRIKRVK